MKHNAWLPPTIALIGTLSVVANGIMDALDVTLARMWLNVLIYSVSGIAASVGFVLTLAGRTAAATGVAEVGEAVADAVAELPKEGGDDG